MASANFRRGLDSREVKGGVFEPALLPKSEKERLCRELLDEFNIRVHSFSTARDELIIPCRVGPDHKNQDREPTAALNIDKLTFKCLGCKASGGLLWFIATHRGTSATEAREWLGKETGTDGNLMELSALLRYFDALYGDRGAKAPMAVYSERTLDPWALLHPLVTDPPVYDAEGRNLGGWGIPEENALRFRVGYAEEYPMGNKNHPAPPSERIVIPHFWKGQLVGWQSRRMGADGTPKYKSSPDFPKDSTIYGYDPDRYEVAYVVESPKSTLRHEHHIHMPATFGASVTETQARLLGRYKKVVFWFDNDPAGWGAYEDTYDNRGKVAKVGLLEQVSQMTSVWAIDSPYQQDPGEMDDETVDRLAAEHAVPWVIWTPPKVLLCHRCGTKAHAGGCS